MTYHIPRNLAPLPPDVHAEHLAVLFTRALGAAGLEMAMGTVITFVRALGEVGISGRDGVYWAGRATLVHRPEDVPAYDQVFEAFWLGAQPMPERSVITQQITIAFDDEDAEDETEAPPDPGQDASNDPTITVRFSATESLKNKDFAACSIEEMDEVRRLMTQLRLFGSKRRSRRMRPTRRAEVRLDLRRTVRHALKADGETIRRAYLRNGERNRRLVLLLDISGSMEAYSRALARFVHAAVVGRTKVEAFALGTRMTRMTRELQSRDPDIALGQVAARVTDWSGGTRLGETLAHFNEQWGMRGMARGAIVVILSDGWDRGDPALLAREMERLQRAAFRVVWVNPLKASAGYAPLAQGMAAALPFVDRFIEGHSLTSLEELAEIIAA